jgi:hypothetical protein
MGGDAGRIRSNLDREEDNMLAVRAMYRQGKIEWLESPPVDIEGMVAVVFLEHDAPDRELDEQEAALLAQSPAFHRLLEQGLEYVANRQTRPLQVLLDELSN